VYVDGLANFCLNDEDFIIYIKVISSLTCRKNAPVVTGYKSEPSKTGENDGDKNGNNTD
jgi:hypothetical protein